MTVPLGAVGPSTYWYLTRSTGAVALLHKLARVSRKRWPESAAPGPGRLPVTAG